jgi:hypothetical protein
MPPRPEHVLLVEGIEDREVIYQLCNHCGFDNRGLFVVEAKQGYERLRDDVSVRPRTPGIKTLGIVVDADQDLLQRWRSLCDTLVRSGYANLPVAPAAEGTIIPASEVLPRLGIWVMPNNQLGGMLEDFLQQLIHQGDALIARAERSVEAIPTSDRRFNETYRSKAVLHTWLAWQEVPGTPLGLAITRQYLNGDHALAQRFMTWLETRFALPARVPRPGAEAVRSVG